MEYRLIPSLCIANGALVNTKTFGERQYIGSPVNAVKVFGEKGADEILCLDISRKPGMDPDFELLKAIALQSFAPLGYGGGLKNMHDVKTIFSLGYEKVFFNRALFNNRDLIKHVIDKYGSQAVGVSIDVVSCFSRYRVRNGRTRLFAPDLLPLIQDVEKLGVGEVLLCSVARDGTLKGPDLKLISTVRDALSCQLLYSGGIGSHADIEQAVRHGADAVAVSTIFVTHGAARGVVIDYPDRNVLQR